MSDSDFPGGAAVKNPPATWNLKLKKKKKNGSEEPRGRTGIKMKT